MADMEEGDLGFEGLGQLHDLGEDLGSQIRSIQRDQNLLNITILLVCGNFVLQAGPTRPVPSDCLPA